MYNRNGSTSEMKVEKPKIKFDPNEQYWVYDEVPSNSRRIHYYNSSLVPVLTAPLTYGSLTFAEEWTGFRITSINLVADKPTGVALVDQDGTLSVIKAHGSAYAIPPVNMNSNLNEPLHIARGQLKVVEVSTSTNTVDVAVTVEGYPPNSQVGYPNKP